MKVYVDELPKSCEECPCYSYSEGFCNCEFWWQKYKEIKDVQEYTHLGYKQNERPNDCPLQSLSDYTKQVRKEVIEQVYKVLEQAVPKDLSWSWAVIKKELGNLNYD